jgi:hypothetical protein
MKDHKRNKLRPTKHAQEVASMGRNVNCPLNSPLKSDFITWLKLLIRKFEFRLLYCDLSTCFAFIMLVAASMRFHVIVFPNRWIFAMTMLLLIAACILFIGVHLIQHREQDLKIQAKTAVIDWNHYRRFNGSWNDRFGLYLLGIIFYGSAYLYNATSNSSTVSSILFIGAISLFVYGIYFLTCTIRAKEHTQIYVMQAAGVRKIAA